MDSVGLKKATITLVSAALVAGIAFPATADAKVSCEGRVHLSGVDLVGLPTNPEPQRDYAVTIDLPRNHAVNPRAVLMGVRCRGEGDGSARGYPREEDFVQFRGRPDGPAGSSFQARFPRAGRWRLASMDQSGSFRDHGFFVVRSAAGAGTDAGGIVSPPLVIAAAILASAALAVGLLRRARRTQALQ